jgi:methionine-rich copper-binding protein CopC
VSARTGIIAAMLLTPLAAWAHAFPDHCDPRVGHSVEAAPAEVRIWFDGEIEPVFSTIRVEAVSGQRVDKGDGHVDAKDKTLLTTSLQPGLAAGKYRVFWSVIARDGHRTEGDYPFRIK